MELMKLSINEPFISPAFESNFTVFSGMAGDPVPEAEVKEYIAKACRYAKRHQTYLVPERFLLSGYHSLCLISPEGRVVGSQKAIHRNHASLPGKRSTRLEVIPTLFGGVFLCVDVDVYRPEIPRLASAMGARYLIVSQSIRQGDYDTNMVLLGVWSASQGSPLYTIGVSNQFHCICAPRALTENDDGFLATPRLKMPLTARLQADHLDKLPKRPPLSRSFYAMHRAELIR